MRFPLGFLAAQFRHRRRMEKMGRTRFPGVLMLEPLYTCNLACIGCSTERYTGKLSDRMPLEQCFKAVEDCQAPIINICGGEPTLYPELKELIEGLYARDRHVILCTNALKLDTKVYDVIKADPRLFLMIHLDGMRETHDFVCDREGVFDRAIDMIKLGKKKGYKVYLNCTVYKQTDTNEVEDLCKLTDTLRADGIFLSPGYEYDSVKQDVFLTAEQISEKFQIIRGFASKYRINATPTFLEFAAGMRDLNCSPWSTVNYTPKGWKAPCYLIDGEGYYQDFQEFWTKTNWEYWESRQDPRCQNCRMHSGFQESAVNEDNKTWGGLLKTASWLMGW